MCTKRFGFFNNCPEYERTVNFCIKCATDHFFHFNKLRFSKIIANCKDSDIAYRIVKYHDCVYSHYFSDFKTECINANGICQK